MPAMPDARPRFLNFPDRDPKVILGAHINATNARALTRMTIGTFEMSVGQVEAARESAAIAKSALAGLAKERKLTVEAEKSRDHVSVQHAKGEGLSISLWVTTPLEPTQSAHLVWARVTNLADGTVGIAAKLANDFSANDMLGVIRKAESNQQKLGAGEPYVLNGNPPPRFAKKTAAPADAAAPA